ncbi:hypothetical protein D9M71_487370 [compost metagenome]
MRHYFNTRHNGNGMAWALPAGAVGMIALAFVTGPNVQPAATNNAAQVQKVDYQPLPASAIGGKTAAELAKEEAAKPAAPAEAPAAAPAQASNAAGNGDFEKVHSVIQERCTVCHSAKPTSPMFSTAPAGVMFDTPEQIQQMAPKIQAQAVASQIMPLGNITKMTPEERKLIGEWIAKGAPQ